MSLIYSVVVLPFLDDVKTKGSTWTNVLGREALSSCTKLAVLYFSWGKHLLQSEKGQLISSRLYKAFIYMITKKDFRDAFYIS